MTLVDTKKEIWNKAIQYLSRREYSRVELATKLFSIGEKDEAMLDLLEEQGYLSDRRFAESFVRMRVNQGHGLNRIRFDLRKKGIGSDLLQTVLEELDVDWYALASELYQRKYRAPLEKNDHKERNKRIRFMSQRGYLMDEIQWAINNENKSDFE